MVNTGWELLTSLPGAPHVWKKHLKETRICILFTCLVNKLLLWGLQGGGGGHAKPCFCLPAFKNAYLNYIKAI